VSDAGVEDGHDRDGDEGTDDAGQHHASGDGHDHGERVDGHRTAHDDRLQDMALQLLHQHDRDERDQRHQRAAGYERDEDRYRTGDGGADDRE
jgi:hypothetical protein